MRFIYLTFLFFLFYCNSKKTEQKESISDNNVPKTLSLVILGTLQDGGSPHAGCTKDCCKNLFSNPDKSRKVVSLGIIDPVNKKNFLFEAGPDLPLQLRALKNYSPFKTSDVPDGIFLTHAHIGHYSGLMYLGKEAMNTSKTLVYTMPRMKTFLESNGPWSQLISQQNIQIVNLEENKEVILSPSLKVIPIRVPHRDEYSETVGYLICSPRKKVLFIPDIDKWSKWNRNIVEEIKEVDHAFIDGTFFDGKEINNRNISEIPHPFVIESMELLESLSAEEKGKIWFIHFNHTNPLLKEDNKESALVNKKGFHISKQDLVIEL
jgi:pyrroloquinoline quinone biosynthesis protein B